MRKQTVEILIVIAAAVIYLVALLAVRHLRARVLDRRRQLRRRGASVGAAGFSLRAPRGPQAVRRIAGGAP